MKRVVESVDTAIISLKNIHFRVFQGTEFMRWVKMKGNFQSLEDELNEKRDREKMGNFRFSEESEIQSFP